MRVQTVSSSLLAVLVLPLASAQTPVNLIGGGVAGATHVIQRQRVCNPATPVCAPVLGALPARWAGGTACDPIRQAVWESDGLNLVAVSSLTTGGACTVLCPPIPAPGLPPGAFITGLAFEEDTTPRGALWSIDSEYFIQRMVWPTFQCANQGPRCDVRTYMPTPLHRAAGLAISERHRLVLFSASDFTTGNPPNNFVLAVPLAPPTTPLCSPLVCRFPVPACALGPITGAAFDDCTSTLYLTDGRVTAFGAFLPGSPCTFTLVGCCTNTLLGSWSGLDLEPSHSQKRGRSCLGATCAPCPAMSLDEVGDAALLNTNFGYRLTGAPDASLVFCFVDVGPCTAGIPALCGMTYWPTGFPWLLDSRLAAGPGVCAATTFHPAPIPMDPSLCGHSITVQDVVICPGFGIGLSNSCCTMFSDT